MNQSSPANHLRSILIAFATVCALAFYPVSSSAAETGTETEQQSLSALEVYKDPACGCCRGWVKHMEEAGFTMGVNTSESLAAVKQKLGIEPRYQSCHTAVSASGYFFEGHIPARIIARFLLEKPEAAAGLAVPGMPMGSPGMEMGDFFNPYDIYQINRDGSTEVYAQVKTAAEQY